MFRPGGYSSEDDDDDEFGEGDYYTNNKFKNNFKQLSKEEIQRNKLEQFYNRIIHGDIESVITFIHEGLDVNSCIRDGWTPLLLAASYGNADLAIELIKLGADVNCTKDMETPLMAACRCPNTTSPFQRTFKIIECLILNKADVNFKNRKRMTALMFAASTGNTLAVEYLLHFCNKDDVDIQGWSALFWAINDNNYETFLILLQADLDCSKMDVRRMTPLDYAKLRGCKRILDHLPDPDRLKNDVEMIDSHYNFYDEIKRLHFKRDVSVMLNAVGCFHLHKIFTDHDIDLYTFLTLSADKLREISVEMPLMQNRILGGIHKFHKHSFQKKALSVDSENTLYTTTDIANDIFTAMRQLTAMRGTLKYLELNLNVGECNNREILLYHLNKIENSVQKMERLCGDLKQRTKKWDQGNTPVDLITPKKTTFYFETKFITISALITICMYIKKKMC